MGRTVICGIEDWERGAGAVQVARELASRFALPILFVHVTDGGDADGHAEELLRHAAETAGVEAEWAVETGHPADRIVELAAEREAAFVVLGTHGPRSSLLGSISADVSRRATCPVVVVPPGARVLEPAA